MNVTQLITDQTLKLSVAYEVRVPLSEGVQGPLVFKDIKATQLQTALLTADGQLCLIDHKQGLGPEILSSTIKVTNLKNIVQIESSLGHFLALKKAYRKSIYDWDTKTLEIWMGRNGFDFCMGVIKYGRITGSILANASFEFMRDTLGITDENLASKLKGELEKVRKECM